ncbi:MAG TPA: LON peptidase substrate-binding domain-containing protein [Acidimicrobiales bacterium]|nr:LON peptidase substrate-binding domain-containing protein [Acidimicrobiales bacterium]
MDPRPLAMFPLSTVLFPHADLSLHIFEPRYRELVRDCLDTDGTFGVVLITRGSEVGGGDRRTGVGTMARIRAASPQADGRWVLVARGSERFRVAEWLPEEPYPLAMVGALPAELLNPGEPVLARAASRVRRVRALLSELGDHPALPPDPDLLPDGAGRMWELCTAAPLSVFDRQRLLESEDPLARLRLLIELCEEMAEDVTRLLAHRPDPTGPAPP